jgi:XRE family transcriptional regulator, aerobic/anaerobic benzoate catabolism transcriptional regulator
LLATTFGLADAQGREQRIALVGLRGAGKTTLGGQLAASRGVPFIELDREIEREAGTSMNEILLLHGQAGYRRYERRALLRIAEEHADGVVMTTGGSIVSERETFDLLQNHFYCVWVKASPEEHMSRVVAQGDMRPFNAAQGEGGEMSRNAMGEALEDIRRILASREALYARADAVVDTAARTVKQSLKDLERAVPAAQALTLETR